MVQKREFGDYSLYVLKSGKTEARVTDLGATLQSLRFAGRETVLGYDTPEAAERQDRPADPQRGAQPAPRRPPVL